MCCISNLDAITFLFLCIWARSTAHILQFISEACTRAERARRDDTPLDIICKMDNVRNSWKSEAMRHLGIFANYWTIYASVLTMTYRWCFMITESFGGALCFKITQIFIKQKTKCPAKLFLSLFGGTLLARQTGGAPPPPPPPCARAWYMCCYVPAVISTY